MAAKSELESGESVLISTTLCFQLFNVTGVVLCKAISKRK